MRAWTEAELEAVLPSSPTFPPSPTFLSLFFVFSTSGPSSLKSIHCFPLSSSSISCSWLPPFSDFDSYEVECRRYDNGELTSALRLMGGITSITLDHLEAFRKYSVMVRVSSAGQTSPPATHSTVTMIDRESCTHTHTHAQGGAVVFK